MAIEHGAMPRSWGNRPSNRGPTPSRVRGVTAARLFEQCERLLPLCQGVAGGADSKRIRAQCIRVPANNGGTP